MRMTLAKRILSARTAFGYFAHRRHQDSATRVDAKVGEESVPTRARLDHEQPVAQEAAVAARGVIMRQEVPLLTRYGTSYGLFDEWSADYACVLKSDVYRLGEYVGDSVWASGPLRGVIGGMPVMEVTHLELLEMKWMR